MKRLFVFSLVVVLSIGLFSVGALAQPADASDSDSTYVEWVIDAPMQCSLELDAHSGIDFGTLDEVGDTYSASDYVTNGSNRRVEGTSNCEYEVNLQVSVGQAPIPADTVLEDFVISLENTSASNSFDTWNNISNNDSTSVGSGGDNSDYSTEDNDWWQFDYSYTTDYDDVNDSPYVVNLEYTASTN